MRSWAICLAFSKSIWASRFECWEFYRIDQFEPPSPGLDMGSSRPFTAAIPAFCLPSPRVRRIMEQIVRDELEARTCYPWTSCRAST